MKSFYAQHRGLHRWLIADGAVLLLFFLLRGDRALMNALVFSVTLPLEQFLGRACAQAAFSVAEAFYALLVLSVLACLALSVRFVRHAEHKRGALYRCILFFADYALSFYAAFCLLWGANYCVDDFCDKSGIFPEPVSCEDLFTVTERFTRELSAAADTVARDESGVFAAEREALFADAVSSYAALFDEFPFLAMTDLTPKSFHFSKILSALGFTGFYFPFTGEANVNTDFPPALLPATMLHEMTHQRGIASEQQCNFLAILAATRSQSPAYRYSGYLMGYIYLSNALYRADYDAWLALRETLPNGAKNDLDAHNAYWKQHKGWTAKAAQGLNNRMIVSYGDELGVQSYGAVVDLLVKYFAQR